jgi:hypothetical protein
MVVVKTTLYRIVTKCGQYWKIVTVSVVNTFRNSDCKCDQYFRNSDCKCGQYFRNSDCKCGQYCRIVTIVNTIG